MSDWSPRDLVTLTGVKLLSRPDMETRVVPGFKVPQRFGRAEFHIEVEGEPRLIRVGSNYWDAAVEQFADIQGDTVDVTFLPMPYAMFGKSGTSYYFYEIREGEA